MFYVLHISLHHWNKLSKKQICSTETKDLFGQIICQNVLCCFYRILERDVWIKPRRRSVVRWLGETLQIGRKIEVFSSIKSWQTVFKVIFARLGSESGQKHLISNDRVVQCPNKPTITTSVTGCIKSSKKNFEICKKLHCKNPSFRMTGWQMDGVWSIRSTHLIVSWAVNTGLDFPYTKEL